MENKYEKAITLSEKKFKLLIGVKKQTFQKMVEVLQEAYDEMATEREINPNLLSRWKTEVIINLPPIFKRESAEIDKMKQSYEIKIEELYIQIGKLSTEIEWLKRI